jgi:peptidoglycan/LPS O-acetylase OafA/YrhL
MKPNNLIMLMCLAAGLIASALIGIYLESKYIFPGIYTILIGLVLGVILAKYIIRRRQTGKINEHLSSTQSDFGNQKYKKFKNKDLAIYAVISLIIGPIIGASIAIFSGEPFFSNFFLACIFLGTFVGIIVCLGLLLLTTE